MPDLCGENGVCTDTSGRYTCGCLEGYADTEGELCISMLVIQDLYDLTMNSVPTQILTSAL